MAIYQIDDHALSPLEVTSFQSEGIWERRDLQSLLRDSISTIAEGVMVLSEEFGAWEDSRRRIDLLCLDTEARLVVVELKRTDDGGHMDLQAIRYAAMVSKMTFSEAVEAHRIFLERLNKESESAETRILDFLSWSEPKEEEFANDVRLILASAEFSNEIMTSVMWLHQHDVDISCVRLKPYKAPSGILLDVQQIFPLPEAEDYQIKIREKERRERQGRTQNRDLTRYDLTIGDEHRTNLAKLRLAYFVVREAIIRGVDPRVVIDSNGAWVAIHGKHSKQEFLIREKDGRDTRSSDGNIRDFLTKDDELIHWNGSTYALRGNMWGRKTLDELNRIIEQYDLSDVRFRETAGM